VNQLGKYIVCIFVVMAMMLLYVHQQLTIIQSSYRINTKEEQLVDLMDVQKNLKFQLASLKSPISVEQKLADADISLVVPNEVRIVKVPVTRATSFQVAHNSAAQSEVPVMKLLGLEREAEAKLSK